MKKKFLDGSEIDKNWLLKHSSKCEFINNAYLSLVNIEEVEFEITVDYDSSDTCLIGNGYKCMMYMPLEEKWCLSVFINRENEIVEWYFDMTKENAVENDKPYFIDLYLDIAVSHEGKIAILDEDELSCALEEGIIEKEDYKLAKDTCDHVLRKIIPNDKFMKDFFYYNLEKFLK